MSEVEELLTKHAFEIDGVEEVAGESVIDVDVLPNRSSDCLSHRGVAANFSVDFRCVTTSDPLTAALPFQKLPISKSR